MKAMVGRICVLGLVLIGCKASPPRPSGAAGGSFERISTDLSDEAKRLLAMVPADLQAPEPAVDERAKARFLNLVDVFGQIPPDPRPPVRPSGTASKLEKLAAGVEWVTPQNLEKIREALREGPLQFSQGSADPETKKRISLVHLMMPSPLWRAAASAALAGNSKAASDDFGLAIIYCRSMVPSVESNPNAWMFTLSAIKAATEEGKLDKEACRQLLTELPDGEWARNQKAAEIRRTLRDDVVRVADMEVPAKHSLVQDPDWKDVPVPPYGTLNREDTLYDLVALAQGDIANIVRPANQYSDTNFKQFQRQTAPLPNLPSPDAKGAFAKLLAEYVRKMNALPNSLGLECLHAINKQGFWMFWQFVDGLDGTRKALLAASK